MPRLRRPKHHPWVWLVVLASVIETLIIGLGLTFGPQRWASSSQYGPLDNLLRALPGDSMRAWGWAFLFACSLLIFGSLRDIRVLRAGFVVSAAIAGMWATAFASSLLDDKLVAIGSVGAWSFITIIQSAAAAGDGEAFRWMPRRGK